MTYTEKQRDTDNKTFEAVVDTLVKTHHKKSKDYGNSWRILGLIGITIQIVHKAIRIWNLRDRPPENEALKDSYKDIAVYAIMAMMLISEGDINPRI